ncbi:terminase small subunit [Pseudomonas sp. Marseille-Q5115]|uniref:terminase small subunit n=1 Tax=Pseudomonas sp. Marseille-Q5115 TaxID=2866593 RepID=UPI001CE3BFC1|nr:terminase small subunit [Pseudomonas sp. Marseille-Q5115]
MALTPKKRAFVAAVREGASNRNAAIAAGCPEKTASAAGSRLAKDPDVLRELGKVTAQAPVNAYVNESVNAAPSNEPGQVRRYTDPLAFLMDQMNDPELEAKDRRDAAKALMPFVHQRKGEGGKKEQAREKAAEVAAGKFGTRRGPLRSVK